MPKDRWRRHSARNVTGSKTRSKGQLQEVLNFQRINKEMSVEYNLRPVTTRMKTEEKKSMEGQDSTKLTIKVHHQMSRTHILYSFLCVCVCVYIYNLTGKMCLKMI